ncbi:MAG: exonuclease subunit SbcD [Chloroflexota bacterium]|nr:MAG: nuclease SbcCD subunit D [Bellilinea sp.]
MLRILHFADAHIDIANYGRHDPQSGLPMRVLDFLKALDTIVETAINEKVDLVLFAGDAYKDRTPAPTFQREWGKRIIRLSRAGIPCVLLIGNHDLSPALGRAHALQEYQTLEVDHVLVIDRPRLLKPEDLFGLPLQIMAIPWISRSSLMAHLQISATEPQRIHEEIEKRLQEIVQDWFKQVDSSLPTVLAAHATVQGARYGKERSIMLGNDLVLPGSLVRDRRLDYVALGHIHLRQNLNEGSHPPVVYPGSIERVDFGEADDRKYFVIAGVQKGQTELDWRELHGRRFIDRSVNLLDGALAGEGSAPPVMERILAVLPPREELRDAIVRLTMDYPRDWDALIDEGRLRRHAELAFDFHLVRRPHIAARGRISEIENIAAKSPLELLELYWETRGESPEHIEELKRLAEEIIHQAERFTIDFPIDLE